MDEELIMADLDHEDSQGRAMLDLKPGGWIVEVDVCAIFGLKFGSFRLVTRV